MKKIQKYLSSDIFKTYDKLNNQEKRELWGSIIESIEIKGKNELEINFFNLVYQTRITWWIFLISTLIN